MFLRTYLLVSPHERAAGSAMDYGVTPEAIINIWLYGVKPRRRARLVGISRRPLSLSWAGLCEEQVLRVLSQGWQVWNRYQIMEQ